MIQIISLILFLLVIFGFGFITLNKALKIKSNILLFSLCFPTGTSFYIFTTHVISFITGPQIGSLISLFIIFLLTVLAQIFTRKENIEEEVKKKELTLLVITSVVISILTYLSMFRYGFLDKAFHIPLATTLFHNDIYPPKDFFRPEYILLYHHGGDLLAGAINNISKINISTCFEVVSSILSGVTFLCFFALSWVLTKDFRISAISGFCAYFGGGMLWIDAIFRFISKNLPLTGKEWGFFETFCNLGVHGSIINPPSMLSFSSTSSIGNALISLSLIIFWKMINEKTNKLPYILFLNISLFSLFLSAEWLYITFLVALLPFFIYALLKKDFQSIKSSSILVFSSIILNKTLDNVLFLQDFTQTLGRRNIVDIGIKENLFSINTWGRLNETLNMYSNVSCFSWDFISEFGLSLILIPFAIVYLIKSKNLFAMILFSSAFFTMPAPAIIDFKANPTDLNRLFCFGNTMLIILIVCGVNYISKGFFRNKVLTSAFLLFFCISPLSQLALGILFTPNVFSERSFSHEVVNGFTKVKNTSDLLQMYKDFNMLTILVKNTINNTYKNEIDFLARNSNPGDLALSSIPELPFYAGIYSLTPPTRFLYQDIIYSLNDSVFLKTFSTLDPYLLKELNIKWVLINNTEQVQFSKNIKNLLKNKDVFQPVYFSGNDKSKNNWIEIYKVNDLRNILPKYEQKTSWVLINRYGEPVEISALSKNTISLYTSHKTALIHLNELIKLNPNLKNEIITVKLVTNDEIERYIKQIKLNISLEKISL